MPRVRRVSLDGLGHSRRRRGRGFEYRDVRGAPIRDPETLERIRALAIPPAWTDVWICPDPWGHLQASGVDAAGRRQYLYHERWRAWRDRRKFRRMRGFARRLLDLRTTVSRDLGGDDLGREQILALATRLLNRGLFRIGGKEYAERNGSFGLSTLRKNHVRTDEHGIAFDFPAKGGIRRRVSVRDEEAREIVRRLKRRRGGGDDLLAYRDGSGWHDIRSVDVNAYIHDVMGDGFTAKDFRTWHATVLAAVALALRADEGTALRARKRSVAGAVKEVAEILGNTPAVCRSSYIDPAVFDAFLEGRTIAPRLAEVDLSDAAMQAEVERAVLELLSDQGEEEDRAAA
jgi:DNA topoisomerase I